MLDNEVTVEISTKDRYNFLPLAILSIAQQSLKPKKLLIFDDGEQKDLRNDPVYQHIFALLNSKNIEWEVIFGERKGQVLNHQKAIEMSKTELIFRVDDDDVLEPNVLEILVESINKKDNVGAVGGLIFIPGLNTDFCSMASGKIEYILSRPNVQWSKFTGDKEVDHLNNSFLFRKSAAKHGYCLNLSPVGHREETLFTYGILRNGYKLIVDPRAITWHMRSPSGGIRSYESSFLWEHDEKIFMNKLKEYGISLKQSIIVVLDCGLGDHYAFKMMLPELKEKHKNDDLILSVCYPEVFEDENVQMISIAEAKQMGIDMDKHNIYRWMIEKNWKDSLTSAYRKMLL